MDTADTPRNTAITIERESARQAGNRRALSPNNSESYIGGATPSFSTTTRCADELRAAHRTRDDEHLLARRSGRVRAAGAKVTTGTFSGTVTELLPPLYDSFRSRPLVPCTTLIDVRVGHRAVRTEVPRVVTFAGAARGFREHEHFGRGQLAVGAGRRSRADERAGLDVRRA